MFVDSEVLSVGEKVINYVSRRSGDMSLVEEGKKDESAWLENLQLRTPEIPFRKSGSSSAVLPLQY